MPLTFGGKPIAGTRALPGTAQPRPAALDPEAPDRIVLFMRLVAINLEARRDLADVVAQLREIDVDALNDPALAEHPRRPAMVEELAGRERDEYQAAVRLIQTNASLSRQWRQIAPDEKHRYALTFLVGESDPEMPIMQTLYCDDRGLARLVPFPEGWAIPHTLAPASLDDSTEIRTYDLDELLQTEYPSF